MSAKRKFCDHCNEFVSLRTYRQHVDLYFNKSSKKWLKCGNESSGSDVQLDDLDHHIEDDVCVGVGSYHTLCDSGEQPTQDQE